MKPNHLFLDQFGEPIWARTVKELREKVGGGRVRVASPDVTLVFHGSIALITPLTEPATIWVHQHLEHEESLYWCGALVVEPRYLGPIVAGMANDGLVFDGE